MLGKCLAKILRLLSEIAVVQVLRNIKKHLSYISWELGVVTKMQTETKINTWENIHNKFNNYAFTSMRTCEHY